MTWLRKRKLSSTEAARRLREQALAALQPSGGEWSDKPAVSALFEIGFAEGAATLACFADGTTSLYLTSGGGVIGAGEHESVRHAADRFLEVAARLAAQLTLDEATPLPGPGEVRFYVTGAGGVLTAAAPEAVLAAGGHPLSPLFAAGQAVITAIRESMPPQ